MDCKSCRLASHHVCGDALHFVEKDSKQAYLEQYDKISVHTPKPREKQVKEIDKIAGN